MINQQLSHLRVAIVYDHLTTQFGGAELVLQTLLELFPHAPIYTSVYQPSAATWIERSRVRTSFLQRIPWLRFRHQLMVVAHPLAFESLNLSQFQLIISVTAGAAKGVITNPNQLHLCYQLTPPRFLYGQLAKYFESFWMLQIPGLKTITQPLTNYLRRWDQLAAHRPDKTIAISQLVANRIKRAYQLSVDKVIYPPCRITYMKDSPLSLPDKYFICITRLINYKRIDLAIAAALQLKKILIIVGEGREKARLVKLAGAAGLVRQSGESLESVLTRRSATSTQIIFLGSCSEPEKFALLRHSQALLMPGIEDFGLTGLEAAGLGKPIIVHRQSGIAELLKYNQTSIQISQSTAQALVKAIRQLPSSNLSAAQAKHIAQAHTTQAFKASFANMIYQFWQQHSTIAAVTSTKQAKPLPNQM